MANKYDYTGEAKLVACEFLGNDINGNNRYKIHIMLPFNNAVYIANGKGYYRKFVMENGDVAKDVYVEIYSTKSGKMKFAKLEEL